MYQALKIDVKLLWILKLRISLCHCIFSIENILFFKDTVDNFNRTNTFHFVITDIIFEYLLRYNLVSPFQNILVTYCQKLYILYCTCKEALSMARRRLLGKEASSETRTTDAQRGNSLHCTAENSLPHPNF